MADYTCYWKHETFLRQPAGGIVHTTSNQRRMADARPGDVLWIVTFHDGRPFLLGRLIVSEVVSEDVAKERLGDDVYPGTYHALARPGSERPLVELDLMDVAPDLTFESRIADRLPEVLTAQSLRAMRKLTPESARLLRDILDAATAPRAEPGFVPGCIYRRPDLHATYGGQQQGGISTPADHPMVLLFTGESGEQYGYSDGFQDDGLFLYTGEGQVGDMQMTRGNLAIRDHLANGESLHLFEYVKSPEVRYLGEVEYMGHRRVVAPDRQGDPRTAIVFELAIADIDDGAPIVSTPHERPSESSALWNMNLEDLKRLASARTGVGGSTRQRQTTRDVRQRSEAVRVYVLRRAAGVCEGCGEDAPFVRPDGRAFLEAHHIRRIADGGPDHPRWVAALCPNCHRRVHCGADGDEYNVSLAERIGLLEE